MNRDAEYTEILRERLTEKRFIHSLNVAESSKELAKIYGYDEEIAYTAGLIHDCCKDTPAGLQLSYMLENGADLTEIEISTAKLYHAMCGSIYIKNEFGIDNEDIINAKMQEIQPEMKKLQAKYANDPQKLQLETSKFILFAHFCSGFCEFDKRKI